MTEALRVVAALEGKHLFITGVSGFLGKALLEKLLRCNPDISSVTLMLRPSSDYSSATERFWQEIYPSSVFDRLREEQGDEAFRFFCEQKIQCITGELTQSRFALSSEEYGQLAQKIDVVINSAASVNFREPLDQALQINTLSLLHVVDFLEAAGGIPLVHVSTCYVHGYHRGQLQEQAVQAYDEEAICDFGDSLDESVLIDRLHDAMMTLKQRKQGQDEEHALIDLGIDLANKFGWNDTYTFTKWLGEQLLLRHLPGNRLSIVRPSIIESAYEEPRPGWIEGVKVADALTLAYARRRFSLFPARRKGVLDVVPVDRVVNAVILSLAERLLCKDDDAVASIYQVCSSTASPVTVGEYIDIVTNELNTHWERFPRLTRQRRPGQGLKAVHRGAFLAAMQSQRALLKAKLKLSHGDVKVEEKLKSVEITLKLATIYSFYTNPHYVFDNSHLMAMSQRFTQLDQERYQVGCDTIDWQHYLRRVHLPGLERYGMSGS
ncbi:MAG: fatty acyl-CoA reductase [Oleiphilaceae bacterium]|nr:fatty acyl-CoA reductase [Oleiphilaceae bacterium]